MNPPIEGMKTRPAGEEYMLPAWASFLSFSLSKKGAIKAFKEETGYDLYSLVRNSPIATMIDEATGYQRTVMVAWADWVTKNYWGEEKK